MNATPDEPLARLPRRDENAHKGDFGTALIVGGSRGMAGAAALAGMAALRGGAGLVRLAVPDCCGDLVASFEPSYTTIPLKSDKDGRIAAAACERICELAEAATVVACGPGLGRSHDLEELVLRLYRDIAKPMIIDADGLNALVGDCPDFRPTKMGLSPSAARILTPHPGEFARLIGRKLDGAAREEAAVELAIQSRAVVVLKGHRTLITDGLHRAHNTTGNPGMATGGAGDVLTGLICAIACQGLAAFPAARLGVYLHGLAGDLAAAELGQVSLIASDLIRFLSVAFQADGVRSG